MEEGEGSAMQDAMWPTTPVAAATSAVPPRTEQHGVQLSPALFPCIHSATSRHIAQAEPLCAP